MTGIGSGAILAYDLKKAADLAKIEKLQVLELTFDG